MSHLPVLLDQPGYENRAQRTLSGDGSTGDEQAQFDAFTQDASALIRQAAGDDFVDELGALEVPDGILPVAFRVIDRAMENRLGLTSSTQGNVTWQVGRTASSGVYLTDEDEADIRKALDPPDTGFVAVTMSNFDLPEEVSS